MNNNNHDEENPEYISNNQYNESEYNPPPSYISNDQYKKDENIPPSYISNDQYKKDENIPPSYISNDQYKNKQPENEKESDLPPFYYSKANDQQQFIPPPKNNPPSSPFNQPPNMPQLNIPPINMPPIMPPPNMIPQIPPLPPNMQIPQHRIYIWNQNNEILKKANILQNQVNQYMKPNNNPNIE